MPKKRSTQPLRVQTGKYNQKTLFYAIRLNDVALINKIIVKNPEFLQGEDKEGNNALALAIKHAKNPETLNAVLDRLGDKASIKKMLMQPNTTEKMVLMHYIKPTEAELVAGIDGTLKPNLSEMLKSISQKADFTLQDWIDILNVKKAYSDNALHTWAKEGDAESLSVILELLRGYPANDPVQDKLLKLMNIANDDNKTPLELAVADNRVAVVEMMVGPNSPLSKEQQKDILMPGLHSFSVQRGDSEARQKIVGILGEASARLYPPAPKLEANQSSVNGTNATEPAKSLSFWEKIKLFFGIKTKSTNIDLAVNNPTPEVASIAPSKFAIGTATPPVTTPKPDPFNVTASLTAYQASVDKQKKGPNPAESAGSVSSPVRPKNY